MILRPSARRQPRTQLAKMDKSLFQEFQEIAKGRFARGLDKKYSPPTVQRKLLKHPAWPTLKKDLQNLPFVKDDMAQMDILFSPFKLAIVAFLAVLFFGGLIYVTGILNTTFLQVGAQNEVNSGMPGYVNLTAASEATFGKMNESIQNLRLVAICLIFAEIMLIFVVNAFTKVHPALFIVWVFIVFLAVMLSAPISNAYESIVRAGTYGGLLESFTGANWILFNLPTVVVTVGILGGIFMFINIVRGGGEGGL